MKRSDAHKAILAIAKKYKWDAQEEYEVDQVLKAFGQAEFNSAGDVKDANIIRELEELVRLKAWALTFNHDKHDGFFATVKEGYHDYSFDVADLESETKRDTMLAAIVAAINYLKAN